MTTVWELCPEFDSYLPEVEGCISMDVREWQKYQKDPRPYVVDLLMEGQRARRMGKVGRRMALECFDEQQVFAKVKAEYARLLQERGLALPQPTREL